MQMTQEAKFGPHRNETLAEVQARIDRQAIANDLATLLAEFHGKAASYTDPRDWARQVATVVLSDFVLVRRAQ